MIADYDLSQLEASQANLWILLQADAIRAEILADQAERLEFMWAKGSDGGRRNAHSQETTPLFSSATGKRLNTSARGI